MGLIDSNAIFRPHLVGWQLQGINDDGVHFKRLYWAYSVVLNLVVTVWYPSHMVLGFFFSEMEGDYVKTISLAISCISCSIKFFMCLWKMPQIRQVHKVLAKLDERVTSLEEQKYFELGKRGANAVLYGFAFTCTAMAFSAVVTIVMKEDRSLFQPAWFPLDWRNSDAAFTFANCYQLFALCVQMSQNSMDDSYLGMILCALSLHIKMLGIRVAKIGYNKESVEDCEQQLMQCIKDQKNLYRLFDIVQDIISLIMLVEFISTVLILCAVLVGLLFYAQTVAEQLFYVFYFAAVELEIFPACYYGSSVEIMFSELHYEIFSSNWMDQSRVFKKNMILFTERSLKRTTALAANQVPIHLNTFFTSLKATYSLFTLVLRTSKKN